MSLASPDTLHLDSYENAPKQHDKGEGQDREPQEVEQRAGDRTAKENEQNKLGRNLRQRLRAVNQLV